MDAVYFCCDEQRKALVAAHAALNGIDYLEVTNEPPLPAPPPAGPNANRQRFLRIFFVRDPAPPGLNEANVVIEGGERITNIVAKKVSYENGGKVLVVEVDRSGDYSPYTLKLVEAGGSGDPLAALDPLLAELEFSFKIECAADVDCAAPAICSPAQSPDPEIDRLAKDYPSFRRLMLDRLSLLIPSWRERSAADEGVMLVELLAYVADRLSYMQDAVATEAYFGTARRRVSVRRHARLVDYQMHDGCNARVFVHLHVNADHIKVDRGRAFLTRLAGAPAQLERDTREWTDALAQGAEVFEAMHDATLFQDHNTLDFYTWGSDECCLRRGATRATLVGAHPNLEKGDLLIFEEMISPTTGFAGDADPGRRHVVRLSKAPEVKQDQLFNPPKEITEIAWGDEDRLPFAFCISAKVGEKVKNVGIALGNVILADHGRQVEEKLGPVPKASLFRRRSPDGNPCAQHAPEPILPRFRPQLREGPLTQVPAVTKVEIAGGERRTRVLAFDPQASAARGMSWAMDTVVPAIELTTIGNTPIPWTPRRDLLESSPLSADFVAELDEEGIARLRFGDDEYGIRPEPDTSFSAKYRIGNGTRGNIAADAIGRIGWKEQGIDFVRNPLPARGGVDPEPVEHARQSAPVAFRRQERAVTEADWAEVTERIGGVQRARATFRWTGSWFTVFDTVDRLGGVPVDEAYRAGLRSELERYRVVGADLAIDAPRFVSLELELVVCVKPAYFRSDIRAAFQEIFHAHTGRDGKKGLFHPDHFTFGETVYLSPFVAAAQAIPGVDSVEVTAFQRQKQASSSAVTTGKLVLGRLEIARLDGDPDFPEHGSFRLILRGGK